MLLLAPFLVCFVCVPSYCPLISLPSLSSLARLISLSSLRAILCGLALDFASLAACSSLLRRRGAFDEAAVRFGRLERGSSRPRAQSSLASRGRTSARSEDTARFKGRRMVPVDDKAASSSAASAAAATDSATSADSCSIFARSCSASEIEASSA